MRVSIVKISCFWRWKHGNWKTLRSDRLHKTALKVIYMRFAMRWWVGELGVGRTTPIGQMVIRLRTQGGFGGLEDLEEYRFRADEWCNPPLTFSRVLKGQMRHNAPLLRTDLRWCGFRQGRWNLELLFRKRLQEQLPVPVFSPWKIRDTRDCWAMCECVFVCSCVCSRGQMWTDVDGCVDRSGVPKYSPQTNSRTLVKLETPLASSHHPYPYSSCELDFTKAFSIRFIWVVTILRNLAFFQTFYNEV